VPRRPTLVFLALLALAAVVRLNNVLTFPSFRAFDAYGHFVYIWFMAEEWRVPLATTGWSFFHPPLYYAFMAAVWTLLAPMAGMTRLTIGTGVLAMLGLVHGVSIWFIFKRFLPGRPVIGVLAAGLMFFLPVLLYSASFLGNEGSNAILATASIVTVLWVLRAPSALRGALLGVCLGAAMLTKFTAVAIVAAVFGALAIHFCLRRQWRLGVLTVATTATTMLLVCGWFYGRNVSVYGTPFKLSRDEFMVRRVENYQSQGRRDVWEYVLFDPLILRRPQWPRGLQLTGIFAPDRPRSALRESVPTGLYANAWFDGGIGTVLPPPTQNEASRRAGQVLLTLGLVPSLLVLVGLGSGLRRLRRDGWDDTIGVMLLAFGAMVALFIQATKAVPMHAAVKATYMTPASLTFAFWFGLGADWVARKSPRALRVVVALCAVLGAASVLTFTHDLLVGRGWLDRKVPLWDNIYGVVAFAGGDRSAARRLFEDSAAGQWYLAEENLGYLDLQDGELVSALAHVQRAAALQPRYGFGLPEDRAAFDRITQADYHNQMAVILYRMGRLDEALSAAERAYGLDHEAPEIEYDLALLKVANAVAAPDVNARALAPVFADSRKLLSSAVGKDPGFREAAVLSAVVDALAGDCEDAVPALRRAVDPPGTFPPRLYPTRTGPGDIHAAALQRRMHVATLPDLLEPSRQLARCTTASRPAS